MICISNVKMLHVHIKQVWHVILIPVSQSLSPQPALSTR